MYRPVLRNFGVPEGGNACRRASRLVPGEGSRQSLLLSSRISLYVFLLFHVYYLTSSLSLFSALSLTYALYPPNVRIYRQSRILGPLVYHSMLSGPRHSTFFQLALLLLSPIQLYQLWLETSSFAQYIHYIALSTLSRQQRWARVVSHTVPFPYTLIRSKPPRPHPMLQSNFTEGVVGSQAAMKKRDALCLLIPSATCPLTASIQV